jgi:hypothetical protein
MNVYNALYHIPPHQLLIQNVNIFAEPVHNLAHRCRIEECHWGLKHNVKHASNELGSINTC